MKILLEPVFEYDSDLGYAGMKSMTEPNQDQLDGEIVAELKEIFPEPARAIKRVGETNYYSVNVLNDSIDSINTWYKTHLNEAIARGYVAKRDWMIQLNEDVYDRPDDEPFEAEKMTIRTNTRELLNPDFDFDTEEGRRDVMSSGSVNVQGDLYEVTIPNLYAKETNFMGLLFYKSTLNNSIFTEAFLPMTKFNGSNLTEADFRYADLMYAGFQQADLTGANFKDANLTGADFYGSNWQNAINLADNPTFTAPVLQSTPVQQFVLQQEEAEDDEALEGDKNTCYAVTDLYDKNIDKYLAKNPGNFILVVGDNKECESLDNLKQQYYSDELRDVEGYYECSQSVIDWQNAAGHTKIAFNPEDYITDVEYVKVGSYNQYIIKPDWFYDGPAPEPRVFKLVSTGERKRLISKRIASLYGTNVVSDVHCDPKDTFEIFRLEAVIPKKTRRKSTKSGKTTLRLKGKPTKRKTSNTRKLRKVLHHRTKRHDIVSEINVGGGRKAKRRTKKRRKYYKK
jgi:hypothetical protein